jgi:NAD-dependent deacetylase
MTEGLLEARRILANAKRILVLTGAGISADSGVPTFRGANGLWKSHRPEDLATYDAFARDPRLVWEWYAWRRSLVAACRPNAGHWALAGLALARPSTSIVTQNVDGLHEIAAREEADGDDPSSAMPLELHGALFRDRCSGCGERTAASEPVDASSLGTLPRCRDCGAMLRPDVVWFGESLDARTLERAFERAREADVCLVVGTSALVHPAASLPFATLESGGALVEINPEPTPLSVHARSSLRGRAAVVLPALLV